MTKIRIAKHRKSFSTNLNCKEPLTPLKMIIQIDNSWINWFLNHFLSIIVAQKHPIWNFIDFGRALIWIQTEKIALDSMKSPKTAQITVVFITDTKQVLLILMKHPSKWKKFSPESFLYCNFKFRYLKKIWLKIPLFCQKMCLIFDKTMKKQQHHYHHHWSCRQNNYKHLVAVLCSTLKCSCMSAVLYHSVIMNRLLNVLIINNNV